MPAERVIVFIDGSNFYHGLRRNIGSGNINFGNFGKLVAGDRMLVRMHYYNAPLDQRQDPEKYQKQRRFFDQLRNTPNLRLVLVRLQRREIDGKAIYVVKGDDIHIAADMISLAARNAYDTAVLISGDGDFVPAVRAVQDFGKRVENWYFQSGHSWHLRQTCDLSVLMDKKLLEPALQ